jgi:hypothetical protein
VVVSAVTLSDNSRDFIQHLAGECNHIDLAAIVKSLLSSKRPTDLILGSSLKELISQWKSCYGEKQEKHLSQFWQAVIEMNISMKCQRYIPPVGGDKLLI